jgi:hypothetical protein
MGIRIINNDILTNIHEYCNNISALLDTCIQFKEYKKCIEFTIKLNRKNSYKYYSNEQFYNYINSLHDGKPDIYIDLRNNETITDQGIIRIAQNKKIHTMNLHGCMNITNNGLKYLGFLHTLDIGHIQHISEYGIRHLGNVHTLILSYCKSITDNCIRHLGNVHTLNLYCCHNITNEGLKYLVNVHILNISWIKNITTLCTLEKLHTLNLGYTNITDESVFHLAKNGNLHTLDLSCCDITDNSVKYLGNLHKLNLWCCKNITDDGVKHLGNLHTLNLHCCNKITDNGVKFLGNLQTLNIRGCNITPIGIQHIKNVKLFDNTWNSDFGNWGGGKWLNCFV